MENVVNLEQLNYRDQMIKEYIDEKIASIPTPEPTPTQGSGEVYYDYATCQKPYVKWGTNAVFVSAPWNNKETCVFLQVGLMTLISYDGIYFGDVYQKPMKSLFNFFDLDRPITLYMFCPSGQGIKVNQCNVEVINSYKVSKDSNPYKSPDVCAIEFTNSLFEAINNDNVFLDINVDFGNLQEGSYPHQIAIYAKIDMRLWKTETYNLQDTFINIHSFRDENSVPSEWKFKVIPKKTVKVKYHKTQYDLGTSNENSLMVRSRYVPFEDNKESFDLETFLNSLPNSCEVGITMLVRRCVPIRAQRDERRKQFNWIYKPAYSPDNDEYSIENYGYRIYKVSGLYDRYFSQLGQYFRKGIESHLKWFIHSDRKEMYADASRDKHIKSCYLDFLYGGIKTGKTERKYKGGEYNKIRFTQRPQIIRLMITANQIDSWGGTVNLKHSIKYLGNIDPLKIPF